uniref:Non-structural protein 6 n=1 Tax=Rotavirus A TaxID=28875 RepID=A0A8D5Z6S6_9REOV|nr:non-structural protein 6 [Rotavirus A]
MNRQITRQLFLENLLVGVNSMFHQMQKPLLHTCCQNLQKILNHLILLQTIHSPVFRLERMQLRQIQTVAFRWMHQRIHVLERTPYTIQLISHSLKD